MAILTLNIVTPNGAIYEGEVSAISVPAENGVLGILPGHTPLIAQLSDHGVLTVTLTDHQSKLYFTIFRGVLEVKPEKTIVLTEKAVPAPDYESAKANLNRLPEKAGENDRDVQRADVRIKTTIK